MSKYKHTRQIEELRKKVKKWGLLGNALQGTTYLEELEQFLDEQLTKNEEEVENKLVDGIEEKLRPLWDSGANSYTRRISSFREGYMLSAMDIKDIENLEKAVTSMVLYLTKHYHKQNLKTQPKK